MVVYEGGVQWRRGSTRREYCHGTAYYIVCDKSEGMRKKESSYAGGNPVEDGGYYTVYGAEDVYDRGLPLHLA